MSGLRDARLKKALDAAPDAGLLPPEPVRNAVRAAARKAVARPAAEPWWRAVWAGTAGRGGPWNAAFATVLLAGVITLLWHEREIPGPRPDPVIMQAPPPAPVAAPESPAPQARPALVEKKKEAPVARKPAPVVPAAQPQLRDRDAAVAKSAAPLAEESRPADTAAAAVAPPAPAAMAPPPAALPPPVAAPAPAPAMAAPAPARSARQEGFAAGAAWTHLRVSAQGRGVELSREQAGRLGELVDQLARGAQGGEPLAAPVTARIELLRAGQAQGVLELAGPQLRWRGMTGRPDPAALQALAGEIERALAR